MKDERYIDRQGGEWREVARSLMGVSLINDAGHRREVRWPVIDADYWRPDQVVLVAARLGRRRR